MKTKKSKKKTTGDFKIKSKFVEFIGGKGHLNFLSDEATILGKDLVGLGMEDITFKLKIYSDGSIDFDEVDTNKTTKEERERLLNIIEDQTISSYRNRSVINELCFTSVEKVKDKTVPLYLAVEYTKPIEKLSSLFDETEFEISDGALDNLNDLLSSWDVDSVNDDIDFTEENIPTEESFMKDHDNSITNMMQDSFKKMKEEKLNELKEKKSKTEKEIYKLSSQLSTLESSLKQAEDDLKLIEVRIEDIKPIEDPNGYYFFVSERCNETVQLDPDMDKLIREKVSKIKQINVEGFMKLFTNGEYHISISKVAESGYELIDNLGDLTDDILEKLSSIGLVVENDKLVYNGEMGWGEIVNKMVKMGFEQNPDFDKFCGSNSYFSKEETKSDVKNKENQF